MKILAAISFGLALVASCLLLVLPTYSGWSSESPLVQQHATLLQVNGPRALIPLAIPVLIALIPVLLPKWWVRLVAGVVLGAFVGVAGFSNWALHGLGASRLFSVDVLRRVSSSMHRAVGARVSRSIAAKEVTGH